MASSSSSNGKKTKSIQTMCKCGLPARIFTSKTTTNPGRRFWRCSNWMKEDRDCHYFVWVREDDKIVLEEDGSDLGNNWDQKLVYKLIAAIEDVKEEQKDMQLKFRLAEERKIVVLGSLPKFMIFACILGLFIVLLLGKLLFDG